MKWYNDHTNAPYSFHSRIPVVYRESETRWQVRMKRVPECQQVMEAFAQ